MNDEAHVVERLYEVCKRSIVPIMVSDTENPDRIEQCGTGTLFSIGDKNFLVTAAHVLYQNHKGGRILHTVDWGSDGEQRCTIPLIGLESMHNPMDHVDVGIFELTKDIVDKFQKVEFLRLSDIDFRLFDEDAQYYLHGYTQTDTHSLEKTISFDNVFKFIGPIYKGDTTNVPDFNPEHHILIHCPRYAKALDGSTATRPECLKGISGTSIWRARKAGQAMETWSADQAKVVAVQTRVSHPNGDDAIKGTTWLSLIAMLWEKYPDLRNVIRLHHPEIDAVMG